MTTDVDSVLVDTNVLLAATTPDRDLHQAALNVFNDWPRRGIELCVSGQVLREYLVVATRDRKHNGLGLSVPEALDNVAAFLERSRFLGEGFEVTARLRALLQAVECRGKKIHDANLVATAQAHGVSRVVTANLGDFKRFQDRVELISLAQTA